MPLVVFTASVVVTCVMESVPLSVLKVNASTVTAEELGATVEFEGSVPSARKTRDSTGITGDPVGTVPVA